MRRGIERALAIVVFVYVVALTALFETLFEIAALGWLALRRGRLEEAMRFHNWLYGRFIVRALWPLARVRRLGTENIRADRPVMWVLNHRSFADVFLCSLTPSPQGVALARAWPFRIPVYGFYMRLAGYIDIESTPFEEVIERASKLKRMGVSFACFPEGHRSRDGKLQRFKSGGFALASEIGIPVAPIVVTGTERITLEGLPILRPTRIDMEFLPQIDPESFPEDKRALRLKRHVESLFREKLGE